MPHPFDSLTEKQLRTRECAKWTHYPEEILPLWVADMDYPIAEPICQALRAHISCHDFGYPPQDGIPGMREAVQGRLEERFGWQVEPDDIMQVSGIVPCLYLSALSLTAPGDEIIIQTPAYPPFAASVSDTGRTVIENPMRETGGRWELDLENLEEMITPATRMIIFCNPQNPTGRVFTREELQAFADIVVRHNLWVVSDELHADLVLAGEHIPLATLGEDIAQRTITLYGPTKAFNIAGLRIGFLITQNAKLMERIRSHSGMLVPGNVLAQKAALAAYRSGAEWLDDTLDYLRGNSAAIAKFVADEMPLVRFREPEGTYLAWLDFRDAVPAGELEEFLLEEARVALNPGTAYGSAGTGFVRLNFATSRGVVMEALTRLRDALARR
jgi:cystathionine beta-lyase